MTTIPASPEQAERRRREVVALLAAASAVLGEGPFTETARTLLAAARALLGAEAGFVAIGARAGSRPAFTLLDPGGLELTGELPASLRRLRGRALAGATVVAHHLASRPGAALENALVAPIRLGGEVAGLLGLINRVGGFSATEVRLADLLAEMAAVALPEPRPRRAERTKVDALTAREVDVLRLLAKGNTNRQIGALLGRSERTVENHRANLMGKLGLVSRVELVTYAEDHRLR